MREERRVAGGRPAGQLVTVSLVRLGTLALVTEREATALTQETGLSVQPGQTHQAVTSLCLSQPSRGSHHCRSLSQYNLPPADWSTGHQSVLSPCEGMTRTVSHHVVLPVSLPTEQHQGALGTPEPPWQRADKTRWGHHTLSHCHTVTDH